VFRLSNHSLPHVAASYDTTFSRLCASLTEERRRSLVLVTDRGRRRTRSAPRDARRRRVRVPALQLDLSSLRRHAAC